MKYLTFTKEDRLVLYASVYPSMLVICYLMMGNSYFQWPVFVWASLLIIAIGTASWVLHITAANVLRHNMPQHTKTLKRIAMQLMVYVMLTQLMCITSFYFFNSFNLIHASFNWLNYKNLFLTGLILNAVATSTHEGLMFFENWKKSLLETEKLKKINLQIQLDSLKTQVNPHFLFNSLNCLSSLISSDPDKASEFLDEMSKVYRYLLRSNDGELISLSAELQFISSFFHMLKTRYGSSIALQVDVYDRHKDYLIPPLTLQMLVENAVKHNVILKDSPLQIKITSDMSDFLTVSNNIQKKSSKILSNKVGLQNIITKYQLLNYADVTINNDAEAFSVSLPLIKNLNYESVDYRR